MEATTDGFELANEDLRIRGHGTVFGERQSGMADLEVADILRDVELLVAARNDALLGRAFDALDDTDLQRYGLLPCTFRDAL